MRYPRLTYLSIGILLGVLSVAFTVYRYNEEITRIESYHEKVHYISEQTMAKVTLERDSLRKEVTNLKSKTKITEVTNADGSSKKVFENDTESSSESVVVEQERTIALLEHSLQESKKDLKYQLEIEKKSRPAGSLYGGYTLDKQIMLGGSVNVLGNWVVGGCMIEDKTIGIGVGIQF